MKNTVNTWIEQIRQDHRRKLTLAMVLAAFAILVAGVVFWQLHTTGVAMSNEVYCGMEEHVHDENCYEQALNCGLEESEGHVHDDSCYETVETLVCTDDSEEHVHTEECYETEQILTCGLEESEGHTHTDACYENVLTCQIPEHTHSLDCMVDETADVETAADWEATLPEELSDDTAENIVAVAESQIGYTESEKNFILAEDGETRQGYTRYGAWYGNEYGDWDAMFASFCLNYAGISGEDVPYGSGAWSWMTALGDAGLYEEDVEPAAGDLVFLDTDEDGQVETVAVVTGVSDVALTVVQGNSEDAVEQYSLYLSDDSVMGYSDPASEVMPLASTVLASGTMDNAAGDPDAISWVLEEDEAGSRTLTISGDGAIPDCTSSTAKDLPWAAYIGTSTKLVFAGNITRIGNYSFAGARITELEFLQDTELTIGSHAFQYFYELKSIHFPSTVVEIEDNVFIYNSSLTHVEFEEGITSVGAGAFSSLSSTYTEPQYIPASLVSIGANAFAVSAYEVSEDNPAYCSDEEGILYTKDMKTLVDYPRYKYAESYTVPASVETICSGALHAQNVGSIYILNRDVDLQGEWGNSQTVQRVYFADGVRLSGGSNSLFYYDGNLVDTRLPENTELHLSSSGLYGTKLTFVKIPNGTYRIDYGILREMKYLEQVYYDATEAELNNDTMVTSGTSNYELTIGDNVNILPTHFDSFVSHASSIDFIGENILYITPGVLDAAPAPYTGLSGWIYVDADGVIYQLDPDTGTAALYYIPESTTYKVITPYVDDTYEGDYTLNFTSTETRDLTAVTVPAEITVGQEITAGGESLSGTFTVTTVASKAAKDAAGLTAITFEDASAVTLEDYALANCPLSSVTDLKTGTETDVEEDAEALFGSTGYRVFYNTYLKGAENNAAFGQEMDGSEVLNVTDDIHDTLELDIKGGTWQESDSGDGYGGYQLLTGEQLTVEVLTQATDSASQVVYRIYFQFTDEEGTLLLPEGTEWGVTYTATTDSGSYTYTYCKTDDPMTFYLELDLGEESEGTAIMFDVGLDYPVPTAGGGVTIWGEIAAKGSSADGYPAAPEDSDDYVQAYWATEPMDLTVAKTNTSSQDSVKLSADESGTHLAAALNYTITSGYEGAGAYGKDYVKRITYEDVLTLPDGVSWDPEVLEMIGDGRVYRKSNDLVVYLDGAQVTVATVKSSTSGVSLTSAMLSINDDGEVVLSWTVKNDGDGEIPVSEISVTLAAAAFSVDVSKIDEDESGRVIENAVTQTVHYTYAESSEDYDDVDKTITVDPGEISLAKSNVSTASYFGEDWTYSLTLSNSKALPWTATTGGEGTWSLADTLDANLYISAANMEKMFEEAAADSIADLTITITGAELGSASTATAVDGETEVTLDTANSNIPDATTGNTITITCSGTAGELIYSVSVEGGTTVTGEDLQELLDRIGYGVTYTAQYGLKWTLGEDGTYFTLAAGESHVYYIYATVKDTFQQLVVDNPSEYGSESTAIDTNRSYLYRADGTQQTNKTASGKSVFREAEIQKSVMNLTDGSTLSSPDAASGDILQYTLTFHHSGSGVYEDLPMVDDLYGDQFLLAPAAENEGNEMLSGAGTTEVDGTEYYVLTPGTYSGVYVGLYNGEYLYADSITVVEADDDNSSTGYHTQIKWYFSSFSASTMEVTYLAVAAYESTAAVHNISNTVWMNDKTDDRIYASLWGGGTPLGFVKDIVLGRGTDADGDTLAEDRYSAVGQGEQVTYRLTLSNDTDGQTLTLSGANMADSLPATYDAFEWSKDNVTLTAIAVDTNETGKISITSDGTTLYESGDADYTTDAAAAALADYWTIGDTYYNISGCYMLWDSSLTFTFENECTLYLYVTLTFPSNEDGGSAWADYARDAGGNPIYNTLYINRFSSTVSHDLAEPGEVLLQKGVYELARKDIGETSSSAVYIPTGDTRFVFNNQDNSTRCVVYYVTLYNGGNVRYYLSDITDTLPEGLTFERLIGTTNGLSSNGYASTNKTGINTVTSANVKYLPATVAAEGVTYRSAYVELVGDSVTDTITFSLRAGSDSAYALHYDEERDLYYLDRDEAVVFGYVCTIGTADETGDTITNGLSMDYYDYLGMGAGQISENDVAVRVADVTYNGENIYLNTNDGDRGVEGDLGEQQSLTSSVTLVTGQIMPGVTKSVENEQIYGTESVHWTTKLINDGEASLVNYTYSDTMQAPFVFEGDVSIAFYGGEGDEIADGTLFTIGTRSQGDTELAITSNGTTSTLTIGGDPVTVSVKSTSVTVTAELSISKDDNGNEVLTLVFESETGALQENGGYMLLDYYTRNSGTSIESGATYVNTALLTPTQPFSNQHEGTKVTDENGNPVAVTNYAGVTVTLNSSTTAWKSVTETGTDNTGSTSSSQADTNKIVLDDADSTFVYTLSVQNDTDYPMTRLTVLDDLPYVGDTCAYNDDVERYSEFAVLLASRDFTVTVTTEDGTTATLDQAYYTVEVSESLRGNFSAEDHDGTSTEGWEPLSECENLDSVETIRVIIQETDESGVLIPARSTVSVSFTCRANLTEDKDGNEAEPAETAWNNFGYHFHLGTGGSDVQMEAMPMSVGVEIPSVPGLTKTTQDLTGAEYQVAEDTEFTFVIYEGEELKDASGNSYKSQEELLDALKENSIEWREVTLTVEAGESASDTIALTGSNGLSNDETWWKWVNGNTYTIVEYDTDAYDQFQWEVNGVPYGQNNSYTFTYDSSITLELSCSNIAQIWEIDLLKVDSTNDTKVLSGAVFALYSPDEEDLIQYSGDLSVPETITENGTTYYLCSVETSDRDGLITWKDLTRDQYYIVEIEAPDGYNLLPDPIHVLKSSAGTGNVIELTAENTPGAELPMTGGTGTVMIYVIGAVIAAGAAAVLIVRRRRAV